MYTADFHHGGQGGRRTANGPVCVYQHQADVGREIVQRHVHAEMFADDRLAPGPVEGAEQRHGQVRDYRVGQPLAEVHTGGQAAERGRPVRGLLRLADQRHGVRQQRAAAEQHERRSVFGGEPERQLAVEVLGDDQVKRGVGIAEQPDHVGRPEHGLRGPGQAVQYGHVRPRAGHAELPPFRERDVVVGHRHRAEHADVRYVRMRRLEIADDVHVVAAVRQRPQIRQEHHVMAVPVVREHAEYAHPGRYLQDGGEQCHREYGGGGGGGDVDHDGVRSAARSNYYCDR